MITDYKTKRQHFSYKQTHGLFPPIPKTLHTYLPTYLKLTALEKQIGIELIRKSLQNCDPTLNLLTYLGNKDILSTTKTIHSPLPVK